MVTVDVFFEFMDKTGLSVCVGVCVFQVAGYAICIYWFMYDYDFGLWKLNPQYNQNSVLTMPSIA